jgi:hypothetical protein
MVEPLQQTLCHHSFSWLHFFALWFIVSIIATPYIAVLVRSWTGEDID